MHSPINRPGFRLPRVWTLPLLATISLTFAACNSDGEDGPAGPDASGTPTTHQLGDVTAGKEVFLFETFGNEGFWTDAVRLPAGIVAAGITPVQALGLGLVVDVDRLSPTVKAAVAAELAVDPTGASSALLNSPATTLVLLNANAIPGFAVKDTNGDGVLDVASGDKVGATCALCHTTTDGSVLNIPGHGSIGRRIDGPANHNLDFGTLVSVASNSRALYPVLQLALTANANTTLGRASTGLTETSTEAEVDAYLKDKAAYPVGMFDDTFDGNGDPMHNMPLFAQGLAGPYGSEGTFDKQDDFANLVYTGLLDLTFLTTTGGRAFLNKLGGAAGDEIVSDYVAILAQTGVTGYPYVQTSPPVNPADAGGLSFPLAARVDSTKLSDLNAFLFSLPSPAAPATDQAAVDRGEKLFRASGCTGCHNVDQSIAVPTFIVKMKDIFPGDAPVILAQRTPPLNPVQNTVGSTFDDKMAVVNASIRGGLERGTALPLLLDLARKPVFLHDNSVASLEALLNPSRGETVPHPFYVRDASSRSDVIEFLESRQTPR